jgi:uncharacterized protein (TIGR02246 family)
MTTTASSSAVTGQQAVTEEQAVSAVLDRLYTAWVAGDADAIAGLYTTDATVIMPGVYHVGAQAIRAWFAAGFAGRLRGSAATDEARSVRFPSPDAAIVTGTGGILMAGETSMPADRLIRATWVLSRQQGDWRIAAYHNCPLS